MRAELEEFFHSLLSENTYTHSNWNKTHFRNRNWQAFEELVGALWNDMGYKTETLRPNADGGVDVIAKGTNRIPFSEPRTIAIQAKMWNQKVPEREVRDLYGVHNGGNRHVNVSKFDKSILVTTEGSASERSGFTKGAKQFSKNNDGVELIDGEKLLDYLSESSLSPLRLGRKVGKKWHLREPPFCGWSKKFSQTQNYARTTEATFSAKTQQIITTNPDVSISMENICGSCMNLRTQEESVI